MNKYVTKTDVIVFMQIQSVFCPRLEMIALHAF